MQRTFAPLQSTMNAPVEVQQQLSCNSIALGCYNIDGKTTRLDIRIPRESELSKQLDCVVTLGAKSVEPTKRTTSSPADDTNSCESTKTSSTSSKVVRFASDKKGRLLCRSHQNREIRTKKETLECWYTSNDYKQFRNECKQEAIRQQKTSYRDSFAAVYAACTKGNFKGVTKERAYVSAASCRGLEVVVFPTLHNDRKNAIATVLKTQAALPDTVTESIREEAIASASRYLSKQARQLARVLGSGDAAVVVANNRIAALQNEKGYVPHCFITC